MTWQKTIQAPPTLTALIEEPDGGAGQTQREIKLSQLVCWRALSGQPCTPAAALNARGPARPDVVLVPIPPSRKTDGETLLQSEQWAALVARCWELAQALELAAWAAAVDTCPRTSPGGMNERWDEKC